MTTQKTDQNQYQLEGDNSQYAGPDGQVVPVVTRAGEEDRGTGQSGGAVRISGVSIQHTPATKIWYGQVSNVPGFRSLPHHHAEAQAVGCILSCHGRIYFGAHYKEYVDTKPGDSVSVRRFMPHLEANMSVGEALVWLPARTAETLVVDLPVVGGEDL